MKHLATCLFFLVLCVCMKEKGIKAQSAIAGITAENYPRVDGSTSTEPLNYIIACQLLGYRYEWKPYLAGNAMWQIVPNREDIPAYFFGARIKTSQTHNAIINLIDNETDIIISARKMSADEKEYARNAGVALIETPVALDALDFLVNSNNPVSSLTVSQIQGIYMGTVTNWNAVGGANEEIKPYIRNANSGSQEMMKEIVMANAGMPEWEEAYAEDDIVSDMIAVYSQLSQSNAICFTPHYYKEYIVRNSMAGAANAKTVAINGIMPGKNSIADKTCPFVAPVYASVRSDLDRHSMAYKMYEWLQTQAGKEVIAESGYVPTESTDANETIHPANFKVFPNPATDYLIVACNESLIGKELAIFRLNGSLICRQKITGTQTAIDVSGYPAGICFVNIDGKTVKVVKKQDF